MEKHTEFIKLAIYKKNTGCQKGEKRKYSTSLVI